MSDKPVATYVKTTQAISARVLAESRKTYGGAVDDSTIQAWVSLALSNLLTEQTRVTQFVSVLAMREIRELASNYTTQTSTEAA